MSELKATTFGEIRTSHDLLGYWWYKQSEADKVIAELEESHKKEVEQLLILNREQANAANRLRDNMEKVIRHQKYRRCLAMVNMCESNVIWVRGCSEWRRWKKWHKRWLELAEKFKYKEAK